MSTEWYFARDGNQQGPVSESQLRSLIGSRRLRPDDLVWNESLPEWCPAHEIPGLCEAAAVPQKPLYSTAIKVDRALPSITRPFEQPDTGHIYDRLMACIRRQVNAEFLSASFRAMRLCGHHGITVAMIVGLLFVVFLGIKTDSLLVICYGLLSVMMLSVFQYTARRLLGAIDLLMASTSTRLSSSAFLDSFALFNLALGVAALVSLSILAIRTSSLTLFLLAVGVSTLCEFVGCIALNPTTINVAFSQEARAGEEAIGIISIYLKVFLRLVPIGFGVGVVLGTLGLVVGSVLIGFGGSKAAQGILLGTTSGWVVLISAALPFFGYGIFVLYSLGIDIIRSILMVPDKLDRLADGNRGDECGKRDELGPSKIL